MKDVCLGVCGIGLEAYWPQFAGLRSRLDGYLQSIGTHLEQPGVKVLQLGMIDNVEDGRAAGDACCSNSVDLLILYVATYALSSTVLPLVQRAKVPVLVLNLQPEAAIDYEQFNKLGSRTEMTEHWLAFCSSCPMPEISNVFLRARIPFYQVTGVLGDEGTRKEIDQWVAAVRSQRLLGNSTLVTTTAACSIS